MGRFSLVPRPTSVIEGQGKCARALEGLGTRPHVFYILANQTDSRTEEESVWREMLAVIRGRAFWDRSEVLPSQNYSESLMGTHSCTV